MSTKSFRNYGWNYTAKGLYHITLITSKRVAFFGLIQDDKLLLNALGMMAKSAIEELNIKNTEVAVLDYAVLPEHIHLVLQLKGAKYTPDLAQNQFGIESASLGACVRGLKNLIERQARSLNSNFKWAARHHTRTIIEEESVDQIKYNIHHQPYIYVNELFKSGRKGRRQ
ncbi:MAG: hypothetical protein P8N19_12775 [Flavobacteriales bacterium]|nr:hypothetical protein [Flavobacteriales bacterium]MDG1767272.1 hypothetical protein [Flavobacteriales bacterium]